MRLNLYAPTNKLSYGICGTNILKCLCQEGVEVSYFPIGPSLPDKEIKKCHERAMVGYDRNAPCVKIWHQHGLQEMVGSGLHVGYPIFELDTFTPVELHSLSNCDALFVCSHWAKKIIEKYIDVPTRVVPLGVDRSIFNPTTSYRTPRDTVFLASGKWEIRKGHDFLAEAFNKAFNSDDNVQLWMACSNPFLTEEQTNKWHTYYKQQCGDKVRFIPYVDTQSQLADLMSKVDCGVFLSRAEGWNLGLLEMMAMGKQVIATDYSGHTEFCHGKNSLLIDTEQVEPANDGIWFHGQGNWAKLGDKQLEQTIHTLRLIHQEKNKKGSLDVNTCGIDTAKKYTWTNSAKTIIKHLGELN